MQRSYCVPCTRKRDKQRRICITICDEIYNRYEDNHATTKILWTALRLQVCIQCKQLFTRIEQALSLVLIPKASTAGGSRCFNVIPVVVLALVRIRDNRHFPGILPVKISIHQKSVKLIGCYFERCYKKKRRREEKQTNSMWCVMSVGPCVRACTCVLDGEGSRVFASRVLVVV